MDPFEAFEPLVKEINKDMTPPLSYNTMKYRAEILESENKSLKNRFTLAINEIGELKNLISELKDNYQKTKAELNETNNALKAALKTLDELNENRSIISISEDPS